jgi:hypothetical protein
LAALLASVPRGPVSRPGHLLLAGFQRREKLRSKEKGSREVEIGLDFALLCRSSFYGEDVYGAPPPIACARGNGRCGNRMQDIDER